MIKMGVHLRHQVTFERMLQLATTCESLHVDSIWIDDHFYSYDRLHPIPYLDPWLVLSGMASATTTVQLGMLVANIYVLHPSRLLQASLTLHSISNERFVLGLGSGWFPGDFKAMGMKKPDFESRCAYLEECCRFLVNNWLSNPVNWKGDLFEVHMYNHGWKEILRSRPSLLIGGKSSRILDVAVRYGDELNIELMSRKEALDLAEKINLACDEVGRSAASLKRSMLITVVLTSNDHETREQQSLLSSSSFSNGEVELKENVLIGTVEEMTSYLGYLIDLLELDRIIFIPLGTNTVKDPLRMLKEEVCAEL